MSHIIMRTAKLKTAGNVGGACAHIERTRDTPNADPSAPASRWLMGDGPGMADRARAIWDGLDTPPRSNAVHGIEVVLTASPEAWPDGWREGRGEGARFLREFEQRSVRWLEKEFAKKGATIVGACMHLDESTPHVHAVIVPTYTTKKGTSLSAREYLGDRKKLAALQDSAGHAFATMGLERGVKGSKAQHTRISEFYSAINSPMPKATMPNVSEYTVKTGVLRTEKLRLVKPEDAKENLKTQLSPLRDQARAAIVAEKKAKKLKKSNSALSEKLEEERRQRRALADQLRSIELRDVLEAYGCHQDPKDRSKWHTPVGRLSVTGQRFMDFSAEHGGGGAIDLVMHIEGVDFNGAVSSLARMYGEGPALATVAARAAETAREAAQAPKAPFVAPEHQPGTWERVRRYLTEGRGLLGQLVDQLRDVGNLLSDKRANAVFLLRDREGGVVGADLRGTGDSDFKGCAPGTDPDRGLFRVGSGTRQLLVTESAIDAISLAELYPGSTVISTGGSSKWEAAREYIKDHGHEYRTVVCASDRDRAGEMMAERLGLPHLPPPKAEDWNRHLQLLRDAQQRGEKVTLSSEVPDISFSK